MLDYTTMRRLMSRVVKGAHIGWVGVVLLAPLWAWNRPAWQAVHLAMIGVTLAFYFWIGRCPITDLEKSLLAGTSGAAAYSGPFIAQLVGRPIQPRTIGLGTLAWGVLWAGVYYALLR